jgi:pseudouridine-5'-phosphate glycosidase
MHRGGEVTMDVSADLTELARTPVAVVCAGAKSVSPPFSQKGSTFVFERVSNFQVPSTGLS